MTTAQPLGIQLYSVRDDIGPADLDRTLARLAGFGFTHAEPYDILGDTERLGAALRDAGLSAATAHASVLRHDVADILDAAQALGVGCVITPYVDPGSIADRAGVERLADALNAAAESAAARGIRIGYHNHWWEIEPRFEGRTALEVLADELAPEVFLEVDTYWAQVGGADVPALLGALGDRVLSLHVKDGPGVKEQPHTAVGKGVIDVPAILAAAPDAQRIVELDECATDIFEAVAESRAYLTALEEGLS